MIPRRAIYALLAFASLSVDAQNLSDIPPCAEKAAFSSISSTGCQIPDFACICKDGSFISLLLPLIQQSCSPADLQKTIAFAHDLCDTVGISLTIPSSTSTGTRSGTPLPGPRASTTSGFSIPSGPDATLKATQRLNGTASPTSKASKPSVLPFTAASPRHDVQILGSLAVVVAAIFPMM